MKKSVEEKQQIILKEVGMKGIESRLETLFFCVAFYEPVRVRVQGLQCYLELNWKYVRSSNFIYFYLWLSVPADPCDTSICSHLRQRCEVVDGLATCVCSEACPLTLIPVCGSDGYSYPNNCSLEVEACTSGRNLTVIALGECGNLPSFGFRSIVLP